MPQTPEGQTELEAARTPNLDALARVGVQGASIPVLPGISPGSGPGHLGLFGYDPLRYVIGRGALEATGIGFELGPQDVAIRCNFCTLDADGNITDRRAGRIPTEESAPLAVKLRQVSIPGGQLEPGEDHSEAALREFAEETGVHVDSRQLLGRLSELFIPTSNFLVRPFVAYAGERPRFRPNPEEVEEILKLMIP